MNDRYKLVGLLLALVEGDPELGVFECSHCGGAIVNLAQHNQAYGLDLIDLSDKAMQGTTPLAPPPPPAA